MKKEIDNIIEGYNGIDYGFLTKVNIINEKIRLLYVGITRAKEMLIMSNSLYKEESDIGNIRKKQNSCVYLNPIKKHINEKRG